MPEGFFRWLAVAVVLAGVAISATFRWRAERTGGPLSEPDPDRRALPVWRLGFLLFWVLVLVDPPWMRWSTFPAAEALRWIGAGLAGTLLGVFVWVFRSLGSNVTPTVVTRRDHVLVTWGPYRWVRHPLYSAGIAMQVAIGLLLGSWLLLASAVLLLVFVLRRVRREEERLADRFGEAYRGYRDRTGALLPKLARGR